MHFWPRITPESLKAIQSILTPFYKPIINQIQCSSSNANLFQFFFFQITMQKIKYNAVEKIKIKNEMQKIKISQQSP